MRRHDRTSARIDLSFVFVLFVFGFFTKLYFDRSSDMTSYSLKVLMRIIHEQDVCFRAEL